MSLCEVCNKNEVDIHVTTPQGKSMQLCWDCNNKLAADFLEINLAPFQNRIYEYSGIRGKKHKFMIHKIIHPMGIGYEAIEVTENGCPGFKAEVLAGLDCDQQELFIKLEAKIKKTLFKRYLKSSISPYGGKQTVIKNDEVVGRFAMRLCGLPLQNKSKNQEAWVAIPTFSESCIKC